MTLTTFAVPDPPAGEDWSFTVPGINLLALQSIIGTFTPDISNPNIVTVQDATGNGNTLQINRPTATQHLMLGQPGALPDDAACAFSDLGGTVSYGVAINTHTLPIDFTHDFSVEWWERVTDDSHFVIPLFWQPAGAIIQWSVEVNGAGSVFLSDHTHGDFIAPGAFLIDGAWHHYVWTWDQANQNNVQFYVDGVAAAGLARPGGYPTRPTGLQLIEVGDVNPASEVGHLDEVAFYPRQLSAGEVLAHFDSAPNGVAAYTAEVLGSGAAALWHLDEMPTDAPRLPTLEVFNGAQLLGEYPSSALQAVAQTTQYTWFSDARGTPGTATPAIVTVGVPPLVVPPGFTLASRTPGIQAGDRWSNVRILYDDALQQITPGYNPYAYPPGAYLSYKQEGS